jgi:hypothetical protein
LPSATEQFVASWRDGVQQTAHKMASDNSTATEHLDHGLPLGDPVSFGLKSVPVGLVKPAEVMTRDTCSPNFGVWSEESDEDDAIMCVRNTFIDIDSGENGLHAVEMHEGGAQTWTVCALGLGDHGGPQQRPAAAGHEGCGTLSSCGSLESTTDDEEPPRFLAPPNGSLSMSAAREFHKRRHPAAESTQRRSSPAAAMAHQSSDAEKVTAQEPSPTWAASSMVLLQVPLQLHYGPGTPFLNGCVDASVAVLKQEQDSVTGSVSLHLQVLLRPPGRNTGVPLPTKLLRSAKADAAPQQRKHPSPGAAAKEKQDLICCHWKKGWCKLGKSCKFKHPANMHGIDAPASLRQRPLAAKLL